MTVRTTVKVDRASIRRKSAPIDDEVQRILNEKKTAYEQRLRQNTPVDTGRLRDSARAEIVAKTRLSVGWFGVPYAQHVEDQYGIIRELGEEINRDLASTLQRDLGQAIRRRNRG